MQVPSTASRPAAPPVPVGRQRTLWLPSSLLLALALGVWTISGGLASCDSTAKFTVPDRQFASIQVVSGFLAHYDSKTRQTTRVCGLPREGEADVAPNAVELTVNFLSSELTGRMNLCKEAGENDFDRSIKEGELVDLKRVKATVPGQSVSAQMFTLEAKCLSPHVSQEQDCASAFAKQTLVGSDIRYVKHADRCDPIRPDTAIDVALVVDNSGSISGLVDATTKLEEQESVLGANIPNDRSEVMSDPFRARIKAATNFIDLLNPRDKVITYFFDETGWNVACSDAFVCCPVSLPDSEACDGKKCGGAHDKTTCSKGESCRSDVRCTSKDACQTDDFVTLPNKAEGSLDSQSKRCFGKVGEKGHWHKNGLELKVKNAATGRASVWQTMHEAYTFLTGTAAEGNAGEPASRAKHIVLLADGPDTCLESDDFNWTDLSGKNNKCRLQCNLPDLDKARYEKLIERIEADKAHVVVHVVQFQSVGYMNPDPRMQEIACRTGGTYQFINTRESPSQQASSFEPIVTAMNRVRFSLSGNWRITFAADVVGQAKAGAPDNQLPVTLGSMVALDGSLRFKNAEFPSLKSAYDTQQRDWEFSFSGKEDRRMLMRRACVDEKDCGGSGGECGKDRCTKAGLCVANAAPNQLACAKGKCCKGACQTGTCTDACKK